jgi:phosphopantetheine adenylyltransferase
MAVNKALREITKRFGITVREARDIATAVGTLAEAGSSKRVKQGVSNLAKQVKEVGTAAAKGKKGTTSNRISSGEITNKGKSIKYGTYVTGKKRK